MEGVSASCDSPSRRNHSCAQIHAHILAGKQVYGRGTIDVYSQGHVIAAANFGMT
jgi:hypothetical protein